MIPAILGGIVEFMMLREKLLRGWAYTIKEMDNSRENSFCCGSCGGLPRVSKNLSDNIAKERILQAKRNWCKEDDCRRI